jgi:hypothetical protein
MVFVVGPCHNYSTLFPVVAQDNRDAALAEHPGLGLPEVTKVLGARWLALPEAKKQEYYNRHDANRQMYEAQLAEFENDNQVRSRRCIALEGRGGGSGVVLTSICFLFVWCNAPR